MTHWVKVLAYPSQFRSLRPMERLTQYCVCNPSTPMMRREAETNHLEALRPVSLEHTVQGQMCHGVCTPLPMITNTNTSI